MPQRQIVFIDTPGMHRAIIPIGAPIASAPKEKRINPMRTKSNPPKNRGPSIMYLLFLYAIADDMGFGIEDRKAFRLSLQPMLSACHGHFNAHESRLTQS